MAEWSTWILDQVKTLRPAFLSKNPHFNFITVHCK